MQAPVFAIAQCHGRKEQGICGHRFALTAPKGRPSEPSACPACGSTAWILETMTVEEAQRVALTLKEAA